MSERRLAQSIALRATTPIKARGGAVAGENDLGAKAAGQAAGTASPTDGAGPSPLELAESFLVAYVPTTIFSGFVAAWSVVVIAEQPAAAPDVLSQPAKAVVAIGVTVLAVLAIFAQAYWDARVLAEKQRRSRPSRSTVARSGVWEMFAAAVATFVWVSILPSSWVDIDVAIAPLLAFGVSIFLKLMGMVFGRLDLVTAADIDQAAANPPA